ncbi:MAG: glycosyltransferase family 2 protein [Pyrinomonadaceae bacterium]
MTKRATPVLTVGIPTWNRAKYVSDAIDSLAVEIEYHALQAEVEILISDNGSEDQTQTVVEERIARYPYVRYVRNKRNMGVKFNVLQVLRLAEGEYSMMLGDDDRLVKGSLSAIVGLLRVNFGLPALFVQQANYSNVFQDIEEDTLLSFEEIYRRYFYDIGNAGVFIVSAPRARRVIEERDLSFFNENWPQTQVLCLSLKDAERPALISTLKAVDSSLHNSLSVYSAYYLWQAGFADLYTAARDMKPALGEEFWETVRSKLCKRMNKVVNGVLFYGSLVDTSEQRRKTAASIRRLIPLLPWSLRPRALVLWMHVAFPRAIIAPLYKARIFILYGSSEIRALNETTRKQLERRSLALRCRSVRENI